MSDKIIIPQSVGRLVSGFQDPGTNAHIIQLDDSGAVSDGYHTFDELYHYRMLYNAAFFNSFDGPRYKSHKHHDGEKPFGGGWFIVTAQLPTGQISNHYEDKYWDLFKIPEAPRSPKWDGHTPQQVAERLEKYLRGDWNDGEG